jgi:iron complex outermembrane receptor protein
MGISDPLNRRESPESKGNRMNNHHIRMVAPAHRARLGALLAGCAIVALAQSAAAAEAKDVNTVDEVTVTARFREESLNTVPIALSVISGDQLASKNLNNLESLSQAVPTVDFRTGASNKDRTVFIRGVGTITTSPGVEPSVSTVLDGVVLSRPGQSTLDLVDIQRIEVLRGPQGTLFGKNASAGVVNIVSKDPTDTFKGHGDASYYGGGEYRFKASLSGPLVADGKLNGLISGVGAAYEGNVNDVLRGGKIGGYSHTGVRGKLIGHPSDDLTVTFGVDYIGGKESAPNGVFSSTDRVAYPTNVVTANPGLAALLASYGVTAGPNNKSAVASIGSTVKDRNGGAVLQFDYKLGDFVLTSISGYRFWKNHQVPDFDNLPVLTAAFPDVRDDGVVDSIQRTQEFRVTSPKGEFFDYVAGLYFMRAETKEVYQRDLYRLVGAATLHDTGIAHYGIDGKNYAVYGEGNFNFTPQFRAILGGRLIRDELSYYHVRTATTAVALTGIRPFHQSAGTVNKDGWSGRVGLQYDLSDHQMVYVTASRGYKGPAYNAFFNMQAIDEIALKPETSTSYEAGIKGSLFEGKLQGNLSIYDTKYENYQANFTDTAGSPPAFVTRLINAGDVSSKGIEGDFSARPISGLRLGFAFARTDAKVDNFLCPPGSPVSCNINGQTLPFAPKWKTHTEAEYTAHWTEAFDIQVATDYSWKSKTQYSLSETPDTVQAAYGIWNASVALIGVDNGWTVRGVVKNIMNQHYSPLVGYGSVAGVVRFVPRDNDRYWGLSLRKDF